MMTTSYDLVVLGAGNAGLAAAGAARAAGQRVLVVESQQVGGVCPLRGCVPKKVLVAAAQALDTIARAPLHEIEVGPARLDWPKLVERERGFVEGVPAEFEKSLANRGIDLVLGAGRFVDRHTVAVGGETYRGDKLVVATGSEPRALPIPGAEHLVTSDDLLLLPALPESIVFVGAGVIAFEFAHVLARAGSRVTLLEVAPRVLPALDADAAERVKVLTRRLGVEIRTGVSVDAVETRGDAVRVRYRDEGAERAIDATLAANGAGRVAALGALELGAAGITLEAGRVALDGTLRSTENPDVYFAGDALADAAQLSPLATYEGRLVGYNLTHEVPREVEYGYQPAAVYTVPTVATVGLSEAAAREAGLDVEVRVNDMREWRSARTQAEDEAWAKVLIDRESGRVVGAHLVGHGAEETIHTFALAVEKGFPATEIAERVYAYPTFHADLKFLV